MACNLVNFRDGLHFIPSLVNDYPPAQIASLAAHLLWHNIAL